MTADPKPLTPEQQWEAYDRAMKNFRLQHELWDANGRKGPPPPRPIRPHTVGRGY